MRMAALIVVNDGDDNNDDGDDDDDNDGDDDDDEEDGKSSCWQVGAELVANGGSGFTQCAAAASLQKRKVAQCAQCKTAL